MKNFFIVLLSCTLALGAGAAERTAVVTGLPGTDGIGANEVPVMETGGQQMPDEWIDKDTGHRVVKLTRRPGTNASFYFHNNPFIGNEMVFRGSDVAHAGNDMVHGGGPQRRTQMYAVDLSTLAAAARVVGPLRVFVGRKVAGRRRRLEDVGGTLARGEGTTYKAGHDMADKRLKSGIIDSQNDVGGWPELKSTTPPQDTDHDGMPDDWERRHGLNPADPADGAQLSPDGLYTNLEIYLNAICAQ